VKTPTLEYDLKNAVSKNRLIGLWRLMTGYRLPYLGANISLGLSALSKTATYLLLRYFIDSYFVSQTTTVPLILIALGFLMLAVSEGFFTFLGGRWAAKVAESVTRRLRNYVYDHLQT